MRHPIARDSEALLLDEAQRGADFSGKCSHPAPWLSRAELIEWLRNQVPAAGDIPSETRLKLREALEQMKAMNANDTRTAAGWTLLRDAAPKVWNATKPVRDALIGELVKKALGL
jgi:hypothetical protein